MPPFLGTQAYAKDELNKHSTLLGGYKNVAQKAGYNGFNHYTVFQNACII